MSEPMKQIIKWLEKGIKIADRTFTWKVESVTEEKDEKEIVVSSELGSMEIVIIDKHGAIIMPTSIYSTVYWDNDRRLKAYRTMLKLNKRVPLADAVLYGDDDDIFIELNFIADRITKKEFEEFINDMFLLRYMLYTRFVEMGIMEEENENDEELEEIMQYVRDQIEAGKSLEEVAEELVDLADGSISVETALEFVKKVKDEIDKDK